MVEKERNIQKIVLQNDGNVHVVFGMCHIAGRELENIIWGCIQLGEKLGLFD